MSRQSPNSVFDSLGDLVFTTDERGTLVTWNDAVRGATGLDDGELRKTTLSELFERVDGEALDSAFEAARETGHERVEATLVTAEGTPSPYEVRFDRLDDGPTDAAVVGVGREITARRAREAELTKRESVLREVYEIMADRDQPFTEQVDRLLALGQDVLGTGYGTLSSVAGDEYVFEVVRAPDDSLEAGETIPLSATNCERTVATEQTLVLADIARDAPDLAERTGFTEWGISCYLGAPVYVDEEVYGTFCFYDETPRAEPFSEWEVTLVDLMSRWVSAELERRHTTDRLRRTNDQLERFAAVVSHDLRNPMNVIEGSLELAADTGDEEHFERCRRALDRMDRLVDDLLSLARTGETIDDVAPVALSTVAERAWETTGTDDATLAVEADLTVRADEGRLRQLFENLFRNAVEHGGPRVTVRVVALDDGFAVADDGSGIPPAEREQVFESGFSTATEGTGFGLTIVSEVAEAHGWDVGLAESADGGARFEFTGVDVVEEVEPGEPRT
ncbi:PAS domain-containing sensor histidine kinase [Salinigranum sp. GCM10025319]|uniref:PAS domain-containing sensor histidine kinase n=1 Tax=Salinigranum sp. GCM10025319 TaxID=3252687 RepID=UPI00361A97D5